MGRFRFYAGLAAVTAATMMLQITETRIISVTSWYHLAFFVISIAMFGLTAGAVWVYLRHDTGQARLSYDLSVASLGFAIGTVLALLVQLTLATSISPTLISLFVWTEFALCLAVPFFFSGVVVSLALTRSPLPIGTVYGADLIGAAGGCLGVLLVLNFTSGPSAVLWTGVLGAAGGLLFSGSGFGTVAEMGLGARIHRRRWPIFAGLLLLAAGNSMTDYGIRPLLVKGAVESPDTFAAEEWNSFSRITVGNSVEDRPALWGPSPRLPDQRIEQRWLTIDGATGTALYRFDGDLEDLGFLRYDISNLAYAIPGLKAGAVIGVGGGRDVLSARLFGVERVTGIEINPIFIDLLSSGFDDYTAIARVPGIDFEVDEARAWFAATERSFDIIQMSLIDTWAATGAGAFTLSENGLYTVEAWHIFLDRLNPDGVFTVSRWYAPGEINETGRMVSLAVAALQQLGIAEPERHLFLAAAENIATLVMSKTPLSGPALAALEQSADDLQFTVLLSPDRTAASPILRAIVSARDAAALDAATRGFYLDLSPATDARPFFFNQLRLDRLWEVDIFALYRQPGVFGGNLIAMLTLAMLVVVSLGLVLATIVVPLRPAVRGAGWMLAGAGTAYFLLIGVGFMMAEIALLQRMSVFLGHPVYALSIVLFSLILMTGLGSLISERIPLERPARFAAWSILTFAYLLVLPWWLPSLLLHFDSAGLVARAGFCVLVLAPAGLLMGFGFPAGMRLVAAIDPGPTPWFWGINGAAGVLAASIAVVTSIAFGIDVTLRAGAVCYLLLLAPALLLSTASARGAPRRAIC